MGAESHLVRRRKASQVAAAFDTNGSWEEQVGQWASHGFQGMSLQVPCLWPLRAARSSMASVGERPKVASWSRRTAVLV